MSGVNNVVINTLRVNNTQLLTLSGEKEIPNEIYNVYVNDNNVYLYYDIIINEDDFKEKEQLDIDLSKIKKNILNYKTQIDNKTIDEYYNENYEINVLLTHYIEKRIVELDAETKSKIQLFTILYKFTNYSYSIVTNKTIKFYKDKEEIDYTLTDLTVLNIKFNYIQDNNNSDDNTDSGNNQDEQEDVQIVFNTVEVEVKNPEGITSTEGEQNDQNDLTIIRFVDTKIIPSSEDDTDENNEKNDYSRESGQFSRDSGQPKQSTNIIKRYYDYTEPSKFDIKRVNNYKNVKFSSIIVNSPAELDKSDKIIKYTKDVVENSLYDHINKFISKMNRKSVYTELKSINGKLNSDKRKKLKKLFTDNGLKPNNGGGANKSGNKKYGNFGISVWNYNREYNALKYFYKESNNNNNTYDTNPLQQVISLMISNYTEIIKYSHTKSIYSL